MSTNYYNINLMTLSPSERRIAQRAVEAHREAVAAPIPVATPDELAMSFLTSDNAEWDRMWKSLEDHPLNAGIDNPRVAINHTSMEMWQYMGTADGKHQFRHRHHPSTNRREYVNIPAS